MNFENFEVYIDRRETNYPCLKSSTLIEDSLSKLEMKKMLSFYFKENFYFVATIIEWVLF